MGWIFFKQHYERLSQIEKEDLEDDPGGYLNTFIRIPTDRKGAVVRFQHEYYGNTTYFNSDYTLNLVLP